MKRMVDYVTSILFDQYQSGGNYPSSKLVCNLRRNTISNSDYKYCSYTTWLLLFEIILYDIQSLTHVNAQPCLLICLLISYHYIKLPYPMENYISALKDSKFCQPLLSKLNEITKLNENYRIPMISCTKYW